MDISYQIFTKEQLLINQFRGDFSIQIWQAFYKMLFTQPEWPCINKVLVDLRYLSNPLAELSKVKQIKQFRKNAIKNDFKTALLINNPENAIIANKYIEEIQKEFPYSFSMSVKQIAEELQIKYSEKELLAMINKLKCTFKNN